MTIYEPDTRTPEPPWPFTGRDDELELVGRCLTGGRHGIVVTGPPGHGKTRLVTEAVRGTGCARVTGTPGTRRLDFAAFAHLLPGEVSLHRAVRLLSGVRLLVVDDAHLLDDASAALVHQLAVHGRTRLVVIAADGGAPVPAAVSRLWTGELLPRLAVAPLPREETARLLTAGTGRTPEPLTAGRLHRLCGGDLRLLRELVGALRERGLVTQGHEAHEWAWRGPVPVTAAVRERVGPALAGRSPGERDCLERLAFAEPLPLRLDDLDLDALEGLEDGGLVQVDDESAVRLAHPLHGPVLRAAAGRLRARRAARTPEDCGPALAAEQAALARRIEEADVRDLPTPVGEWLAGEGGPVPAGYAAVRARFARLRGEVLEAAAWAREGLRETPDDPACRAELALPVPRSPLTSAEDDLYARYDAVRLGTPERVLGRLAHGVFAGHADALARGDGPALDRAAEALRQRGFLLFAAEAYAQAAHAHRDPSAARTSRTRALTLARRCQGARTPALSGLVLGELTARQRQIVALAAAGLSNRQIAERLTLSVRTVGNHLYSAYARLGAGDRDQLPWLVEPPAGKTA
ncbi:LuxR C-terminal-related transcriptional regulator [Streptomyces sp. NPDC001843]|uniref:LuxR family transcriptional regulator AbsR2 n=1 Tax=Streptomyces sp. NPDC001843 TaxID=3364617 RepID=UPI0036935808